jgi:hypothetical protein
MSTPARSTSPAAAELAVDVDPASMVMGDDLRDDAGDDTGGDTAVGRVELPLEANPADVVEQDADVPFDDEER